MECSLSISSQRSKALEPTSSPEQSLASPLSWIHQDQLHNKPLGSDGWPFLFLQPSSSSQGLSCLYQPASWSPLCIAGTRTRGRGPGISKSLPSPYQVPTKCHPCFWHGGLLASTIAGLQAPPATQRSDPALGKLGKGSLLVSPQSRPLGFVSIAVGQPLSLPAYSSSSRRQQQQPKP